MSTRVIHSILAIFVAALEVTSAAANDFGVAAPHSGADAYSYDSVYYPAASGSGNSTGMSPGSAYAGSYPGQAAAGFGNDAATLGSSNIMSPALIGPQVPPMPQMPSWVQAWSGEMSDTERDQLEDVYRGLRRINYSLTGDLMDASDAISDALKADKRDPKTVGKAYSRYFDVQRRWIEAQIAAANRVDDLISKVRARVSQVPPPVVGAPPAAPGAIGAPITIPPATAPHADLTEVPPPSAPVAGH